VRAWIALLLAAMAAPVSAWDDVGHMAVAAVAYERLTPAAHQKVSALLRLNPEYQDWRELARGNGEDRAIFMLAATWPDAIKRAPGYQDDGEIAEGAEASRNTGYGDRLMHKYWHYVDLPFSPDGTSLRGPRTPNALTQIGVFRRELGDPAGSDALKSYDLVWLLHLVGDVHQPLHATSRFDHRHPGGDAGGNRVKVCAPHCGSLHAYWDSLLEPASGHVEAACNSQDLPPSGPQCTSMKITAALAAASTARLPGGARATDTDEAHWIEESFALARTQVYADAVAFDPGRMPIRLNARYQQAARRTAEAQAALAGVRLGEVLNEVFK
jgi:hypothetical protein